jgi:hypothetical protein
MFQECKKLLDALRGTDLVWIDTLRDRQAASRVHCCKAVLDSSNLILGKGSLKLRNLLVKHCQRNSLAIF